MGFLTPTSTRKENGITIYKKILPSQKGLKANQKLNGGVPKYITIHNTNRIQTAKGTTDAEQYARATFNGNMRKVAVHYYLDESVCWQILEENEVGWHAANSKGNNESIEIEIIMNGSDTQANRESEDRGARLAAALLYKYHLNISRLKTHRDWYPKKYCPAYILPHWSKFKSKVELYLNSLNHQKSNKSDSKTEITYCVRANKRWLPEVKNLDTYAGNCGQSITDVMMKVNQGKIKYRVHSKGRWLPWVTGYDVNNFKNGYAGNGVPIDGIQIVYTSENKTTKKAYYRVSQLKRNYFDWQINITTDYDMDGYAGNVNGQPIDRLQIQIK